RRDPALARPALQALAREASRQPLGEAQQAHQQLAAWAYQNQPFAKAQKEAVQRLRQAVQQVFEACALFPSEPER
ncbi:MAG: hypothetical protein VYE34_02675, partial [Pseudomonadota bacterium]|nr:hypothetical protein [Pseudomonadota bacterium]